MVPQSVAAAVPDAAPVTVARYAAGLQAAPRASIRPRRLRILHVVLSIGETSAPYNEHCLPRAAASEITICTYFPCTIVPPASLKVIGGDGSLKGFRRALREAMGRGAYDVVHAHSPHVALLALLCVGARSHVRRRAVVTVHDSYANYKLRNRLLFLPVFALFRHVVCCSYASRDSFPAVYRWLAGRRLCAVRNGMDIDRIDRAGGPRGHSATEESVFNVVAVGRFVRVKNPEMVVAAFRQAAIRNGRLVYIGEGVLRPALAERSGSPGGDSVDVEFPGLIPREYVYEHLLGADLFVSASRGEGLPIAVLEAMACRCPVILSDIPPHREIARGVDFIPLIDPDDMAGFARAIAAMRNMPPAERRSIGERCRRVVEHRFSLSAMHDGYSRLYELAGHKRYEVAGQGR
jgi:glycosyltransferase involved in cell wall biosynthesis